jgi:putative endonuclease
MYHTYIIFSELLNKYYIGSTEDLKRRLDEHNSGRGAFTKGGSPWRLVWNKEFGSRVEACAEERKIKSKKSRSYIEWLISTAA